MEANKIARRIGEAQTRAYLGVKNIGRGVEDPFIGGLTVINLGQTPAYNYEIRSDCFKEEPGIEILNYEFPDSGFGEGKRAIFTPGGQSLFNFSTTKPFVAVLVAYDDIFGISHKSVYVFTPNDVYDVNNGGFTIKNTYTSPQENHRS